MEVRTFLESPVLDQICICVASYAIISSTPIRVVRRWCVQAIAAVRGSGVAEENVRRAATATVVRRRRGRDRVMVLGCIVRVDKRKGSGTVADALRPGWTCSRNLFVFPSPLAASGVRHPHA